MPAGTRLWTASNSRHVVFRPTVSMLPEKLLECKFLQLSHLAPPPKPTLFWNRVSNLCFNWSSRWVWCSCCCLTTSSERKNWLKSEALDGTLDLLREDHMVVTSRWALWDYFQRPQIVNSSKPRMWLQKTMARMEPGFPFLGSSANDFGNFIR